MEKVLFCDIGNVLLFFDLFRSINRFLILGTRPARHVLPIVFDTSFVEDLELGRIGPRAFYEKACGLFGMRITYTEFCRIWNDIFTENHPMTRWIKNTSARHRVYLVSNTNFFHYSAVRLRYDFFRYVTGSVISCEIRLRKPDPRIFVYAMAMAGVKARQVFYLDDIWQHVHAARRCGIRAERYVNPWMAQESWCRFLKHSI